MSDTPDVVALMRVEVIKMLPFGPEVTTEVLQQLATVPYRGDAEAYIAEAGHVIKIATAKAVQPLIDRLEAESAANRAKADLLDAQYKQWLREFKAFERMQTSETIQ
jgi:hypothetical protein